jgi:FkbM family methyltransferase
VETLFIKLLLCVVRRFPAFRGRWRLVTFLRNRRETLHRLRPWRYPTKSGLVLEVNPKTNIDVFIDGFSQFPPHKPVLNLLRPGDFVLDIGANLGATALPFAQAVAPSGQVKAFEAWPEVVADLRRNVALNPALNLEIHEVAVSDRIGEVEFAPPRPDASALGTLRNVELDAPRVKVPAITIDSLLEQLPHVRFVKVDVEGAEGLVLRGMRRLLHRDRPMLLIELTDEWLRQMGSSAQEIVDLLRNLDYSLFKMTPLGFEAFDGIRERQIELFAIRQTDRHAVGIVDAA